ncbi:unnamed protein product [Rotaria magnacalcarata]|uniref:Small integral membrane protein 15 n=3 Tax=Rotaria magnacalcarata TaxID=392030 RepID=A0A815T593_9BILA|nr:unnamed protein product [Rotaria magnacalcarata]CAF1532916.1 unnamed protein product [Rotaria magnacalcarata]CAF2048848.1 unnamed protein product [Rotaria magnacalcarata]CAF2117718.1 unnamed protein product [Rotaria magnacalcarata]CAF2146044.1 unnamed protein product [Rotaria magnacalcarata]
MFSIDWHQKFMDVVIYAATNPWQFLYYIFLCLTPMFIVSGYLAFRLAKDIERSEKTKRAKIQQKINIAKVRKHGKHE